MRRGELFVREKFGKTHELLGGYISPCHTSYLYDKLEDLSIPNSTRNHLIFLALEDDPVWSLDQYMSLTQNFEDNHKILVDFHSRLSEFLSFSFDIFWIMGTDNFELIPDYLVKLGFHMVIIENRQYGYSLTAEHIHD